MCNVAFYLGSIYVLFGKQTLYYPLLLVLESLGASAHTFDRHRVNIVTLACYGGLMRLGGRRLALFVLRQKAGLLVYSRGYWIVLDRGWRHSRVVRALSQHQH